MKLRSLNHDQTVELDVAQATLSELIAGLKLVATSTVRQPRKAGNCKGMITILADDDEHLKDFAEYMP